MKDKPTILIAGATGNVGIGAATALARRGARLVLLGRNHEKLQAKADAVRAAVCNKDSSNPKADIAIQEIDFADMDSVRRAAARILTQYEAIHELVLSAVALLEKGPHILPNGHEKMFATNVLGPFLFTQLLLNVLEQSDGLVLYVIAPFYRKLDWDDLQSTKKHKAMVAYERSKTCGRMVAAEMARRYAGSVSSVAFNPTFVIDKSDPYLAERWPSGSSGFFWRILAMLLARAPKIAGEAIADIMLSSLDRHSINGALFKLGKRVEPIEDKAMCDEKLCALLWDELEKMTGSGVPVRHS